MPNSFGKSVTVAAILLSVLFAYQNCGQMSGQTSSTSSSSNNSNGITPNPTPTPGPLPGPTPNPMPGPLPLPLPTPAPVVFKDQWNMINGMGGPSARSSTVSVWTGSKMLVFGGVFTNGVTNTELNNGAAYDPVTNLWSPIPAAPFVGRHRSSAVWTGSKMIVWGGLGQPNNAVTYNDGAMYDPSTNTWTPMSNVGAPGSRVYHTAIWTGSKMIVFGGRRYLPTGVTLNDGGIFDPATNTWAPLPTAGAPSPRQAHSAVWTGSKMIVFGGYDLAVLNDGAAYDPSTNVWTPISTTAAPTARNLHSAVWTGQLMLVFGGYSIVNGMLTPYSTGGAYNPATNTWLALPTLNAPSPRYEHTALWTGSKMIIHNGFNGTSYLNTGAIFDPATGAWTPITTTAAPAARADASAVWTGNRMVIYGGFANGKFLLDGSYYQ